MITNRKIIAFSLSIITSLPLWGGTGSPRDGLLSFILLFGFLVLLLGILQLVSYMKRRIKELLEDIY
jgi:hypothetical protein